MLVSLKWLTTIWMAILPSVLSSSVTNNNWCSTFSNQEFPYTTNHEQIRLSNRLFIKVDIECHSLENNDENSLIVTLDGPIDRWFGVVFGESMNNNALVFSTGVNGIRSLASVYSYDISGYSKGSISEFNTQHWQTLNMTILDNQGVKIQLSRALEISSNDNEGEMDFNHESGLLKIKYALGKTSDGLNLNSKHETVSSDETFELNLITGEISTEDNNVQDLRKAHGSLMFLGWWLFVFPVILITRYRTLKHNESSLNTPGKWLFWFNIHKCGMITGVSFITLGFVLGYSAVEESPRGEHFGSTHTLMGFITLLLTLMQFLSGMVRPSKFTPIRDPSTKMTIGIIVSGLRETWEYFHRNFGKLLFISICILIPSGLDEYDAAGSVKALFTALLIIAGIVVAGLEITLWYKRNNGEGNPNHKDGNVNAPHSIGLENAQYTPEIKEISPFDSRNNYKQNNKSMVDSSDYGRDTQESTPMKRTRVV